MQKTARLLSLVVSYTLLSATAGSAQSAPAPTGAPAVAYATVAASDALLHDLEQNATVTATDLARLRIERWKVDAGNRKQAQDNANSVLRNLQSALPGMIAAVRANPEDVPASFKLYRNLTALYDVMAQVTELAGAFGAKSEYEALDADFRQLDALRRQLADRLAELTSKQQAELTDLRNQLAAAKAAAAPNPPTAVKTTVVDDNAAPPPVAKTRKAAKPAKPAVPAPAAASPVTSSPKSSG